jgi:hypothetical protein
VAFIFLSILLAMVNSTYVVLNDNRLKSLVNIWVSLCDDRLDYYDVRRDLVAPRIVNDKYDYRLQL